LSFILGDIYSSDEWQHYNGTDADHLRPCRGAARLVQSCDQQTLAGYNAHGHIMPVGYKLRFPSSEKAQFVTVLGIAGRRLSTGFVAGYRSQRAVGIHTRIRENRDSTHLSRKPNRRRSLAARLLVLVSLAMFPPCSK
jgi:hypothetical protein